MISQQICGRERDMIYIDLPEFDFHYTATIENVPHMIRSLDDSYAPGALRRHIKWKVAELERQILIESIEARNRAENEVRQGLFVLCGSLAISIGLILWVVL